jgi:hypothetical protein
VPASVEVAANDKSASHATRLAGTENFKTKYGPDFQTGQIMDAHPGRIMTAEQLEQMGLVAAPEPEIAPPTFTSRTGQGRGGAPRARSDKVWPNYAISLAHAPRNHSGDGPDRSFADFTWCMTAIDWGWSVEETVAKLPEVSERAHERIQCGDKGYPLITAQKAATAVERNDRKRCRG